MTLTSPHLINEVGDLLKNSVSDVFSTTLNMKTESVDLCDIRESDDTLVAGSVGFTGAVSGVVYIYVKAPFARTLTSRMLGMPEAECGEDEMVNDVIGELGNMIVGSTKSLLCDSGAPCVLTILSVIRGQNLSARPVGASESLLLSLTSENEPVLLELIMNPFEKS